MKQLTVEPPQTSSHFSTSKYSYQDTQNLHYLRVRDQVLLPYKKQVKNCSFYNLLSNGYQGLFPLG
jgi:hypothetical protein